MLPKIGKINFGTAKAVFLNRWAASWYRDLNAFLPGIEIFLKL